MRMNKNNCGAAHGSLTVEASLVLPVFIYVIIAFMYFLQVVRIQECLQNAITETGIFTVKYAYVYDYIMKYGKENASEENIKESGNGSYTGNGQEESIENLKSRFESSIEAAVAKAIDSTYYKVKMQDFLDINRINKSCIKDGFDGIHTSLSGFMEEDDAVDIILTYDIRLPLLFIHVEDIPVIQRIRMRGWTGHVVAEKNTSTDTSDENEKMVYITETGNVYHLYRDCTYLNLSIREVNIDQIDILRNDSGGKYKKCSLCGDSVPAGGKTVYITDTGDRYHWNLNCSALKRTIIKIPISEVGDRHLCSRCAARSK